MHRSAVLRWALVGFLGGVALASFFVIDAGLLWAVAAVGFLLLAFRRPGLVAAGVVLVAVAVGAARTDGAITRPSELRETAASAPTVTLEGVVDGDFELTARGGKWPFRVLRMRSDEGAVAVDGRLVVYAQDWVRPMPGQELSLTGKLQAPKNTGAFDYVSYLAKDGIHAQMYFPEYNVPAEQLAVPWSVRARRPLWLVRDAIGGSLARAVPGDVGAYLGGIVLGTRGTLGPELKDAFSRTGTSHILAISGYNITIIAGVLLGLLSRFGRVRSYWLTLAGITAFTLMVGASASVVRAAIMGILALTAVHLGRRADAGMAILLAAVLMCLYNPLLLRWDVGFQLSFLAVLGIVYLEPLVRLPLERLTHEPFARLAATTLAAQAAVLPLILHDFGTLAVYTLPVNLLVLPLVPVAMALGFASGVTGVIIPFAGQLIGQVAWLVAAMQLMIIRWVAVLPYASLEIPLSAAGMLAAYVGLAAFVFSRYRGTPVPPITEEPHGKQERADVRHPETRHHPAVAGGRGHRPT